MLMRKEKKTRNQTVGQFVEFLSLAGWRLTLALAGLLGFSWNFTFCQGPGGMPLASPWQATFPLELRHSRWELPLWVISGWGEGKSLLLSQVCGCCSLNSWDRVNDLWVNRGEGCGGHKSEMGVPSPGMTLLPEAKWFTLLPISAEARTDCDPDAAFVISPSCECEHSGVSHLLRILRKCFVFNWDILVPTAFFFLSHATSPSLPQSYLSLKYLPQVY